MVVNVISTLLPDTCVTDFALKELSTDCGKNTGQGQRVFRAWGVKQTAVSAGGGQNGRRTMLLALSASASRGDQ
ncbi:hypothetical protein C7G83_08400 [Siccibacter turicensis]|uniref:Uncharacterized protein n=1 Tax=Siccibacter turicensis TaxID=357233 RepID=A0A2P8VL56_9ENTR|nr:hypothetical protein C7G83_08400 [Siccibacter turicensis]